jgi:hypothetical protein
MSIQSISNANPAQAKGVGKMRKWLWIGTLSATLGSVGAYWYFTTKTTGTNPPRGSNQVNRVVPYDKKDGDAESSEEIEPLIVDRGATGGQSPEAPADEGPMPRVIMEAGMKQPPRPDAALGYPRRMPYADEEEILAVRLDPIKLILESPFPRLGIFEEIEKSNPAEESEAKEENPPAARRDADPPMNYHQEHCPYHGHCPAPHYHRPMPRD